MKRLLRTVLAWRPSSSLLAIVPAKSLEHVARRHRGRGRRRHRARRDRCCAAYVGRGALARCTPARCCSSLVIASGVLMPAMYVLGVIFAALWFTGIWLGRKWKPPSASASRSPPGKAPQRPLPPPDTLRRTSRSARRAS